MNSLKNISNFIEKYKSRNDLAAVLYDFAARNDSINSGKITELSKEIYSRILANFPNTIQSKDSSLNQRKAEIFSLIETGNDANVVSEIDKFIVDFRGIQILPEAVYRIGEIYWNRASEAKKQQNDSEALSNFKKTAAIWEKIENLMPFSAPDVIEYTYHGLSICYQQLGEYKKATEYFNKIFRLHPDRINDFEYPDRNFFSADNFCGAYTVWHTLQLFGLPVSVDDIIKAMGIYNKGYSSIYDIVRILDSKGIACQAVKVSFDNINQLDRPFIQYLIPLQSGSIGHFVFCIPSGTGKAVVIDGKDEPKVIDLSVYRKDNILETRWDGTAIFIEGINPEFKQNLISWNLGLWYSSIWLDLENIPDAHLIERKLSSELQKRLAGGWSDWDCFKLTQRCLNSVICQKDDDCPEIAQEICADRTYEWMCQLTQWGIMQCLYDPAHTCSPKKLTIRSCGIPGGYCGESAGSLGPCLSLSGSPSGWIFQCHDQGPG